VTAVELVASQPALIAKAERLASCLGLPLAGDDSEAELRLVLTPERLELREVATRAGPVYADFVRGDFGYRRARGGQEALARAAGLRAGRKPSVLDATAGLGQDAFVLASLGCRVMMVERSPIIAALLADGLERAAAHPDTRQAASRLTLVVADAKAFMASLSEDERPQVVYLDPMYPSGKRSVLKGKEMRLFRLLVGDDLDAPALLAAARACAQERVVVKRPAKAPPLGGMEPHASLRGKTTRFDLYVS
jgi:16S rRNA (guanine1516-N2)-methyltransferase